LSSLGGNVPIIITVACDGNNAGKGWVSISTGADIRISLIKNIEHKTVGCCLFSQPAD